MKLKSYMEGSSGPPKKIGFILLFVGIFTAAFGALHMAVYLILSRSIQPLYWTEILKTILTCGLLFIPIGFLGSKIKNKPFSVFSWIGYIWMGTFTILFFFSMSELVLYNFVEHDHSYWPLLLTALIAPIALFKGIKTPDVVQHEILDPRVPKFSIIQISDIHVGMLHIRGPWLVKLVQKILKQKPDILCITGDLVEASYDEIEEDLNVLKLLNDIPHKFYITGNHEYIHGGSIWEKKLDALGFIVLHNSNRVVTFEDRHILFAGVPDKMVSRFVKSKKSDPDSALQTTQDVHYKILLAHQPSSVFDLKNESCDLILSGHTHGGQIFPFHLMVRLVQPVVKGFKTIKGVKVFAHQGTGFWGPPMRWYSRSEIVEFKFTNSQN